jgi:uncharacterized protein
VIRKPPVIDSLAAGGFRVDGVWRPGSLLILADVATHWRPASLADVTPGDLQPILQAPRGSVEFMLLGVGAKIAMPPRLIRDALASAQLGLEFMATEAAARMHNVLASQGRLFATALIAL